MSRYTLPFSKLSNNDVAEVGGKNASLGEMFSELTAEGIAIPDGFATTAEAYREFLKQNDLKDEIAHLLDDLDKEDFKNLKKIGSKIRKKIMDADIHEDFAEAIKEAFDELKDRTENLSGVAVRSSATAEDLPEASFAGQHESFMNITRKDELVHTVKRCFASLFTDRAIKYREDHGFEHMKVALSAGVQKMVRSDKGAAGVAFTIEPDTGFEEVIFINGSWGLGENIVGGVVQGDEFYVFKRNLENGANPILSKEIGGKAKMRVYTDGEDDKTTKNVDTPKDKQAKFCLSDDEIETLGHWCTTIEKHYDKAMDVEWAKDGESGKLFVVQARPETVHSSKEESRKLKNYSLKSKGKILATGNAIGDKITAGKARILNSPDESDKLEEGEVLVTEITNPDWDPILKKASAIVTNSGGRTSHAAIVARELGAVAIVGAVDATDKIEDGQEITVSCAEGQKGKVYEDKLEWEEKEIDLDEIGEPETEVMLILANPKSGYRYAHYPVDGVGLLRLEFAINNTIKAHPLALLNFDELKDEDTKDEINKLTEAYANKEDYFTERLSMAVATIAASFYPKEVIVRMSDFKSNEYADLLGGAQFEPEEENPMLGFRGASRYYHEKYKDGFRLECEAMKKVREDYRLDNVKLMIPFCRTVEEGKKVLKTMEEFGLKRGENGLEVYVMAELPSNVSGAERFAEIFDGFSIGSNDLTQLTLGVDRDSQLVSDIFNEKDEEVKDALARVISKAKKANRKIGLCGQAPSDFPEMAQFLVEQGIDSISFNPDAIAKGIENIVKAEKKSEMENA
ncbi:MAG TPA: phosphoenolpyruvate synthase [Cryomorphaceae bacterium]|nr:phosphoenolpyruvate synthase [Cryomorphaceae bacterium]